MKVIILMYLLLLGHMTLCREVFHVIGAPTRCPQGYKQDYSGRCRKVFFWKQAWSRVSTKIKFEIQGHVGLRVEKAYCCLTIGTRVLHLIQINYQPDETIFQFIILTSVYSSTCFGRFPAHHQELNDCSGSH